ncbi:MAG: hypothetical protein KatS3mg131_2086 [Candidatus Tectimicrobiota bacterium]|nr:MAG: hypothetical protein KatS3mg131_2086 [Candidatus Tectomicrobia bacterium]
MRVTTDPNAPAVRLTEEQIRDTYRWDYRTLTEKCRDRYEDFKVDKRYHELRKQIETDLRYVHVRRLDPLNPKSPRKCFYNPDILRIFDAYYTRRNKRG